MAENALPAEIALITKEATPPPGADSLRATKKVRNRPDDVGDSGEGERGGSDTIMREQAGRGEISYRNKLLNLDNKGATTQSMKDVVVTDDDFLIGKDGEIPSVEFSQGVRDVLVKGMERTLVIKLLGRSINYGDLLNRTGAMWQLKGSYQLVDMECRFYFATFDLEEDYIKVLTGGPWMVFGAYLTVQPWSLGFDPHTTKVSNVVAWARIPGLSFRYYHKSTLRVIGKLLGEVVKIDYMTENRGRGKYARIAVLIDLQQALVPWIKVDGKAYVVEYEGLPLICFSCGKYGHSKERCSGSVQNSNQQVLSSNSRTTVTQPPVSGSGPRDRRPPEPGEAPFGEWIECEESKEARIAVDGNGKSNDDGRDLSSKKRNAGGGVEGPISHGSFQYAKNNHHKPKGGTQKVAQEYRRKDMNKGPAVSVIDQTKNEVGLKTEVNGQARNTVDSSGGEKILGESNSGQSGLVCISEKDLVKGCSDSNVMEVVSTLDATQHKVVEMQRHRPILEEFVPSTLENCVNMQRSLDVQDMQGRGKENTLMTTMVKKHLPHGIKLQSTVQKNLKVRKKPSGSSISKEAIAVLREELETPIGVSENPTCSDVSSKPRDEGDEDPSGSGMVV
ncbi:hypothetical protein K1719_017026 [Acacia pycnantha]|nr:hypothetical protein K1719_017026 [Acacia pycnantha]